MHSGVATPNFRSRSCAESTIYFRFTRKVLRYAVKLVAKCGKELKIGWKMSFLDVKYCMSNSIGYYICLFWLMLPGFQLHPYQRAKRQTAVASDAFMSEYTGKVPAIEVCRVREWFSVFPVPPIPTWSFPFPKFIHYQTNWTNFKTAEKFLTIGQISPSASRRGFAPWPSDQKLCPWTPLGALPRPPLCSHKALAIASP